MQGLQRQLSLHLSAPLVKLIQRQVFEFDPRELASEMKTLRAQVDAKSDKAATAKIKEILEQDCFGQSGFHLGHGPSAVRAGDSVA